MNASGKKSRKKASASEGVDGVAPPSDSSVKRRSPTVQETQAAPITSATRRWRRMRSAATMHRAHAADWKATISQPSSSGENCHERRTIMRPR